MNRFRMHRPSPAMAVALLALFVAMGGAGYAATNLPKNSVGSKQLRANAVSGPKVKDNSLAGGDINESKLGVVPGATNAFNAQNATNAQNAANAQALDGLASGVFERSSRTQFGSGSASPPNPASEGLLLEWDALGVRISAPAQGGCSPVERVTLHAVNTKASGPDVHLYGGASNDIALPSGGGGTIACSAEARRWIGAVTRDGDARTLFFTCHRLGADVRCVGTRSEP